MLRSLQNFTTLQSHSGSMSLLLQYAEVGNRYCENSVATAIAIC